MISLYLYSTLGCHLCEDALAIIEPLLEASNFSLQEVDIANSDALMALYGIRIPVLKRDDTQQELGWPFDQEAVAAFLAS